MRLHLAQGGPAMTSTIARLEGAVGGPFRLVRPSAMEIDVVMRSMTHCEFDYPWVGATSGEMPPEWRRSDQALLVGRGAESWARAVAALHRWRQFDLSWVQAHDEHTPIDAGTLFAFVSRQFGVWSVNVCRIVEVIDEQNETLWRFGVTYGTVGRHLVRGEESFVLEWDRESDCVYFRIRKFSKPGHPLVALFSPLADRAQQRFTREALDRLRQEVCA